MTRHPVDDYDGDALRRISAATVADDVARLNKAGERIAAPHKEGMERALAALKKRPGGIEELRQRVRDASRTASAQVPLFDKKPK